MAVADTRDIVTLHLKTDRVIRDQLLGRLRSRGTTMQSFFDTLMRILVEHPAYIDQIEHWDDDDKESACDTPYALTGA